MCRVEDRAALLPLDVRTPDRGRVAIAVDCYDDGHAFSGDMPLWTGVGAGVIPRDGLSVRGPNTAATLWCAAAVGSLAGAGTHVVAAPGTVAIIAIDVGLRELGRAVDRKDA